MIFDRRNWNARKLGILAHDFCATIAALLASIYVRFDVAGLEARQAIFFVFLPSFAVFACGVYYGFGLYAFKWRFASLSDLFNIFRAVTAVAIALVIFDYIMVSPVFYGGLLLGKITILLYWCLQMFFLGAPRLGYRYFRDVRSLRHARASGTMPSLILGNAADAELVVRAIESRAIRGMWPVGILSPSKSDQRTVVRGVPVLGNFAQLEETLAALEKNRGRVAQLIATPSMFREEHEAEQVMMRARQLGLDIRQLAGMEAAGGAATKLRVARIEIEDLLVRPKVEIDYGVLRDFVAGKAIVVTGGGGSIGSEICKRLLAFGASRILVIDSSEPALQAVLDLLTPKEAPGAAIEGRVADVRDRKRIFRLLAEFEPDLVFHAAALKQLPIVEREWAEAVKTNVFGSINVADAAVASGAQVMVMISTDKAIEPVSVLGATKRIAEMYCHALDADLTERVRRNVVPLNRERRPTRLISVRFGNVLASNGSVVNKFKLQIETGGPVTVTHPEMVRYFMTAREACDLVVRASCHALSAKDAKSSVYVLNMGQPVNIMDMAERMIRLAGLEPNRDIQIEATGMRPGERLKEVLFAEGESMVDVGIPGIVAAVPNYPLLSHMQAPLKGLEEALNAEDRSAVFQIFHTAVPDFRGAAA